MSKCKSCGAEITWIKTRDGKSMPCDSEPVYFIPDPKGKSLIVTDNGQTVKGDIVDKKVALYSQDEKVTVMTGHISHFATCPNANKHRKGKKK